MRSVSLGIPPLCALGLTLAVTHMMPRQHIEGVVDPGDSLWDTLSAQGLSGSTLARLRRSLRATMGPRCDQTGRFSYERALTGELKRFEHLCHRLRFVAHRKSGRLKTRVEPASLEVRWATIRGEVDRGLAEAVEAVGERPELAWRIAALFGQDADLWKQAQAGDRFELRIERLLARGATVGYGAVLAARYHKSTGATFFAFGFKRDDGSFGYYTEAGAPISAGALRWPVRAQITSGFGARRHPVYKRLRPHLGLDLGAARGAPIVAVYSGQVVRARYRPDLGNTVLIRHPHGLKTRYAHMSNLAPQLRPGQRIRRGQRLGDAGSTGLATGVHLHFETYQDNTPIDPAALLLPPGRALTPSERGRFEAQVLVAWELLHTGISAFIDG